MMAVYKALESVKRQVQVIFLCGHNQKLYEKLKRAARLSPIPTAVLPFHDSMSDVMASCDLMVTKAGGLTSYEAIARRLPMAIDMITVPMPQELGTARILCKQELAFALEKPEDILGIVEKLKLRSDGEPAPLPEAHQLNLVDASFNIARKLLTMAGLKLNASVRQTDNTAKANSTQQ